MEEVPLPEEPFLPLDEEPALGGEDDERLLLILGVVEAVRLPGLQDAELDAQLWEGELPASKRQSEPGDFFSLFSAVDHWAS